MGPIDYLGGLPQINPGQALLQGLQSGDILAKAREDAQAKQKAALLQKQYETDISSAFKSPTAETFAALTAKYPQQREAFKQSWDTLSKQQQQDEFGAASQAWAAINSNRPELARDIFQRRVDAKKASGVDHSEDQMVLDIIKADPAQAKGFLGYTMFSADPDKFAENAAKFGGEQRASELQAPKLKEAQATAEKAASDAKTAAVTAAYADSNAFQDLLKKQWDVTKIAEDIDIAKQTNRIRLMEVDLAKKKDAREAQELQLKIEEAKRKRDELITSKAADVEAGATNIDNSLNTIERLKKNRSLNDVLGSIEGRLPSVFSDEASDAIALIDTLGSQSFLSQAANLKGMGALSNAEGEKLQSALTNLSRKQGEKQFRENLDEAARLLKKGRETLAKRNGLPAPKVDTPAAPESRPSLDSFFDRGQ